MLLYFKLLIQLTIFFVVLLMINFATDSVPTVDYKHETDDDTPDILFKLAPTFDLERKQLKDPVSKALSGLAQNYISNAREAGSRFEVVTSDNIDHSDIFGILLVIKLSQGKLHVNACIHEGSNGSFKYAEHKVWNEYPVDVRNGILKVLTKDKVCRYWLGGKYIKKYLKFLAQIASEHPSLDVTVPHMMNDYAHIKGKRAPGDENEVLIAMVSRVVQHAEDLPITHGTTRGGRNQFDVPLQSWNQHVKLSRIKNTAWEKKKRGAVFRGGISKTNTIIRGTCGRWDKGMEEDSETLVQRPRPQIATCLHTSKMNETGRAWIKKVSRTSPTINFDDYNPLSFSQQQKYKIVLNIGQNLDWAERLPVAICGTSAVVVQIGVGFEWYQPLMKKFEDHIPIEPSLQNISQVVDFWLADDEKLKAIAAGGRAFCDAYLTEIRIREYAYYLLKGYQYEQMKVMSSKT